MKPSVIGAVVFFALLSACSKAPPPSTLRHLPASIYQADSLKARYAGATSVSYSEAHGTQVEYTAKDGRAYLWYPGNKSILRGSWRIQTTPEGFGRMCFKYGRNTFNPVTNQGGGVWSCTLASSFLSVEREYRPGDPLGLAQQAAVPFVLPSQGYVGFDRLLRADAARNG